jgi:hypothetical protein
MMKAYANGAHFSDDSGFEANSGGGAEMHSSSRAFELRRAQYFSRNGTPLLNAEQRHTLTNLVEEVDSDTKHNMIVQNLRMVVSIARRYADRGLELVDMVRAGNQGLIHALERFEPEGGFCFSAYLTWCVSQQIEFAIMQRNNGAVSFQFDPDMFVSFDNAVKKRKETCPDYPAGCSGKKLDC